MFVCNSYKQELLLGLHNINHQYYIALFDENQVISPNIKSYNDLKHELPNKDGYITGGQLLHNPKALLDDDIAILDFEENPNWEGSSFSAKGALIYNNSLSEKNAVAIINFGETYVGDYGDFIVEFPEPNRKDAFIRII